MILLKWYSLNIHIKAPKKWFHLIDSALFHFMSHINDQVLQFAYCPITPLLPHMVHFPQDGNLYQQI